MKASGNIFISHSAFTKSVCAFWCLLISVQFLCAETPQQLYSIGVEAYKAKNYQQAIDAYQKLITQGYQNAAVYYNLGNAYYKTDQISLAILNFERAQRLAPADEDIRYNLKLANLKTVDRITPVPQLAIITKWENFVGSQSSKTWAVYSIVFIWLALVGFALYLFISGIRRLAFFSGVSLVMVALFFAYLSYLQNLAEYGARQAILTATNTYIKSAPDASGTDLYMIHEGTKLNILDKVGQWTKIRLADGKIGWVEQNKFTLI